MSTDNTKDMEFYLIELKNFEGIDQMTVRGLRDAIIDGLESGVYYVSIIAPDGSNRVLEEGHTCDDIIINEYIEVLDENGDMDVVATADAITRDMLLNGYVIVLKNKYDEIKDDTGWLDKILEEEDG
jgi:hypothetical protein